MNVREVFNERLPRIKTRKLQRINKRSLFFLKDNKIIPVSESAQNLDKDFFYKTEQLFFNKVLTEEQSSELNDIFVKASLGNELAGFIAGIYLTKNLLEYLQHIK